MMLKVDTEICYTRPVRARHVDIIYTTVAYGIDKQSLNIEGTTDDVSLLRDLVNGLNNFHESHAGHTLQWYKLLKRISQTYCFEVITTLKSRGTTNSDDAIFPQSSIVQ